MKKILAAFSFIVLTITLIGCGVPSEAPPESAKATETPQPTIEATSEPTPDPTPEPIENKTGTVGELSFIYSSIAEPTISNNDGTEMFMFSPAEMVQIQVVMIPQEPISDDAEMEESMKDVLRKAFMDQFVKQFSSGATLNEGTVEVAGKNADYINYAGVLNEAETMMTITTFSTDSAMYSIAMLAPTTGVDTAYIDSYFNLLESIKINADSEDEDNGNDGAGVTAETPSQSNAVNMAKSYLDYTAFSRDGLIEQLEYEGFSNEDATYGADNSGADWMEQAVKSAESYLEYTSFSRQGLIDQLEYEGFTHEQAVHGVDATGL